MKKLIGNQSKLDLNKNGKLDSNDFKMLRGKMAKGGHVSKGEMVWKKLSSSDKIKFLYENFTPEITPRSQETLVGKPYNFLPKNVKIKMEAKYANVENYGNGGGTGVSSETGFAEGTNADLIMNQDYLAYKNGGGVGNVDTELIDASAKTIYDKNGMMGLRNTFLVLANTDEKSGDKSTADYRRKVVSNYQAKQPKFMEDGGSTSGWCYSIGGL